MNQSTLRKILQNGLITNLTESEFMRMYEPEYFDYPLTEAYIVEKTKFLVFDYKAFEFRFKSASISCAGVHISFESNRFSEIRVSAQYDPFMKIIYNDVLIAPFYTTKDYKGRQTINQSSSRINNDKDLQKYIKRIYRRFECPAKLIKV